jgi:hypothetical protein
MGALELFELHLKNRARDLERMRAEGLKIIGYYPGDHSGGRLV